jgi:hypothetical protein
VLVGDGFAEMTGIDAKRRDIIRLLLTSCSAATARAIKSAAWARSAARKLDSAILMVIAAEQQGDAE